MGVVVHLQVRQPQRPGPRLPAGTPQQRLNAGNDLLQAEGLGDVVVPTQREAPHRLLGGVTGGEEQHRAVNAIRTQAPAHLEPVHVQQHHVQQDQVGGVVAGLLQRGAAVPGHLDVEPEVTQRRAHQECDVVLVVDREDTGAGVGRAHAPMMPRRTCESPGNPL